MYRLIFYYENSVLKGKFIDLNNNITYLSTIKCVRLIDELISDSNIIKGIEINDSIKFNAGIVNVTLRNKKQFENSNIYVLISDKVKAKKYKLVKKTLISGTAIGISSMMLLTILSNCKSNVQEYTTPNKSYSDSNDELIVENNYVDDEATIKKENENKLNSIINTFNIGSKVDSSDAKTTRDLYYELIKSYCEKYNVDPDIVCAIATQEQGVHNPDQVGSAIGLMQIEKVHLGETIKLYNYETNEYETYKVTEDNLINLKINILIGIGILQNCLDKFNWNYFIALKAYNIGMYGMDDVLKRCASDNDITEEEIINDKYNIDWNKYIIKEDRGDINYLSNVLRYMPKENLKNILEEKTNIKNRGNSK